MYAWYQDAAICYAFLSDIPSKSLLTSSLWFTRGWTLQELIAPTTLIFFDQTWTPLGSKIGLRRAVSECTGIPASVLSGMEHFETYSIAQRMSWAAKCGLEAVVKLLISTGKVNVDSKSRKMTWTPLIRAARFGHDKMVALLISNVGKAYVDLADDNGRTPFSWAMEHGHEKVVKLLLATRLVNVNEEDRSGITPLMWAAKNKHAGVMELLLSTEKVDKIPRSVTQL